MSFRFVERLNTALNLPGYPTWATGGSRMWTNVTHDNEQPLSVDQGGKK
jgi:hypothetical protein